MVLHFSANSSVSLCGWLADSLMHASTSIGDDPPVDLVGGRIIFWPNPAESGCVLAESG